MKCCTSHRCGHMQTYQARLAKVGVPTVLYDYDDAHVRTCRVFAVFGLMRQLGIRAGCQPAAPLPTCLPSSLFCCPSCWAQAGTWLNDLRSGRLAAFVLDDPLLRCALACCCCMGQPSASA